MNSPLVKLFAFLLLLFPGVALAQAVPPGVYRAAQGPEMAAELEIRADGHFSYGLAYGALDEQAEGTWTATDKGIVLSTEPKPRRPVFRLDHVGPEGLGPLHIVVLGPGGGGLAGVDVRVGFENGAIMTGYTQDYGWTLNQSAFGAPQWVELVEPIHDVLSPRFPIPKGTHSMTVTLIPNDIGVAAFERTKFEAKGDGSFELHHPMGKIRFRAAAP